MIKLIAYLLVFVSVNSWAVDPVQDYLSRNTFPVRNSKFDGQLFAGEWNDKDHREPAGGYLFRFEAPIGSNGSSVIFVTSSLFVSRKESTWSAYQSSSGGSVLLGTDFGFGHLNLYLAPATADRGSALCDITMDKKAFFITAYYFDSAGKWTQGQIDGGNRNFTKEDADPHYLEHEGSDLAKERGLTPFQPTIEKILLVEYLKNPTSQWRVCKDNHLYGQQTDPDEKAHLSAAENFTKQDAAQLWKAERPSASTQSGQ